MMDEQWAREHVGTTPSVGGCGTSYHDERGDVQDCTSVEPCRACLRRRIAQLEAQRGGAIAAPEYPENSFDVRMAVQKAGGMADFDQGIFRAGWEFLASRIQPIPADRVLGDGMVGVDRKGLQDVYEALAYSQPSEPSVDPHSNSMAHRRALGFCADALRAQQAKGE